MLLSQTSQYAVRAAIYLAERGGGPARGSEIAEALAIPRNYLSKILHQLARAGVLVSERGRGGGFRLAEDPGALTLARIVAPVEPGFGRRRCLLGRPECTDVDACPAHERWKGVADRIDAFVQETTLARLVRPPDGPSGLPG